MFDHGVAARHGDHLLVVDVSQPWNLPDRRSVTLQLIGVNNLWNVVFTQEPDPERLCGFGIAVALEQDVEHETVLVLCAA